MKIFNFLILIFLNFSCFSKVNWIGEVEKYFNEELDSVVSDFEQIDSSGNLSTGKIFLNRKKRLMKLYYDDPNPNVAIVKGYDLVYYNRDLKEKTAVTVYSSPFAFFLEREIDLKENLKVISQKEDEEYVQIAFCRKGDEDKGSIVLFFTKEPFQLKGWIILENNDYGKKTHLILKNSEFNKSFSEKIFDTYSLSGYVSN